MKVRSIVAYAAFAIIALLSSGVVASGSMQSRPGAYAKFLFDVASDSRTAIRYGNWYGPGWWGGSEDPKRCGMLPPIDALDKVAQKHDFGYQVAEEVGKHRPEIVAYFKAVADAIAVRDAMALPADPRRWSPPAKDPALAKRHRDRLAIGFKDFVKNWNALLASKPAKSLDPTDSVEMEMLLADKLTERDFEARAMALVRQWEASYRKHLADKAAKQKPVAPTKKVDPTVKKQSHWALSSSGTASESPQIDKVIAEYAAGPARVTGSITSTKSVHRWTNPNREGNPTTSLSITWNAPPSKLSPGGEIVITANAADNGSSSGAPEGDFVSFGVGLLGSHDGKNWSVVSTDGREFYAFPFKKESRTYRLKLPTTLTFSWSLISARETSFGASTINFDISGFLRGHLSPGRACV